MYRIKLLLTLFLSIIAGGLFAGACSDDDSPSKPSDALSIISFTPAKTSVGMTVIISGTGFASQASGNTVFFAPNAQATIDSVVAGNPMKLYVKVPSTAVTGKITVKVGEKSAVSSTDFELITANNNNLFPISLGSYWVYEKYQLDTLNNRITPYSCLDSNIITGTKSLLGQTASILSGFTNESGAYVSKNDQYYYKDGELLYTHSSWFDDLMSIGGQGFTLPFKIDEQWFKVIDPNSNIWNVFQKTFNKETFQFGTVTGTLSISAVNKGYETIPGYANCLKLTYPFTFVGSINVYNQDIPLNITRNMHVWYYNGTGKVMIRIESTKLTLIAGTAPTVVPGYDLVLVRKSIK